MKHGESDGRLMGQTQDWIRTERLRILRAARDGRLRINHHGRYVIDGERRPDRKQREYLLHRRGAITWPEYGDAEQKVRLGASGESLLAQLDSRDLGVSWAKEGVALAGVKSGDIVPGGSEGSALLRAHDRATERGSEVELIDQRVIDRMVKARDMAETGTHTSHVVEMERSAE